MKILIVQFAGVGGLQLYTSHFANSLSKYQDVTILLPPHLYDKKQYNNEVKKEYVLASRNLLLMAFLTLNPFHYIYLIKKINNINPDIIHFTQELIWIPLLLPFIKKRTLAITEHDPILHLGIEKYKKVYLYFTRYFTHKYFDLIFVHGEKLKNSFKIDDKKIVVIPHGALKIKYSDDYKEKSGNNILFFGKITKYKGLEYLINAEKYITEKIEDYKIIIAGEGNFSKYENLIIDKNKYEIHNYYIPDEEVVRLFKKSKIVVLPYIEGTQSGVLSLAHSYKKPVIITEVGSIDEHIIDGVSGIIVKKRDSMALAKAIVYLLKNEHICNDIGKRGYDLCNNILSWDNICKNIIKHYSICSGKNE